MREGKEKEEEGEDNEKPSWQQKQQHSVGPPRGSRPFAHMVNNLLRLSFPCCCNKLPQRRGPKATRTHYRVALEFGSLSCVSGAMRFLSAVGEDPLSCLLSFERLLSSLGVGSPGPPHAASLQVLFPSSYLFL